MGDKRKMRLGDIIVDPTYQVRKSVNPKKVRDYATGIRNGDPIPPMTVERETLRVVDGFTRLEAYRKVMTPDDKVAVILMDFESPADRIAYAAKQNMANGYDLDEIEQEDVISKLRDYGYTSDDIAPVVKWTVNRVDDYLGVIVDFGKKKKTVKRDEPDQSANANTVNIPSPEGRKEMPLKGGLPHLRGQEVSPPVYHNIRHHYVGHSASFLARQILYRIEDDTINTGSESEMAMLAKLYERIGQYLNQEETA